MSFVAGLLNFSHLRQRILRTQDQLCAKATGSLARVCLPHGATILQWSRKMRLTVSLLAVHIFTRPPVRLAKCRVLANPLQFHWGIIYFLKYIFIYSRFYNPRSSVPCRGESVFQRPREQHGNDSIIRRALFLEANLFFKGRVSSREMIL